MIAASGPISVKLPPIIPQPYLVLDDTQHIPGMVGSLGQSGNWSSSPNSKAWKFNVNDWTALLARPDNKFAGIREKITARVQNPVVLSGTVDAAQLIYAIDHAPPTAKTPDDGIVILTSGALTIQNNPPITPIDLVDLGNRRALLVATGNVTINSGIIVSSGGFWGIITSGNITVSPNIGEHNTQSADIADPHYPPHLVGIYYAQGIFDTGTTHPGPGGYDSQLRIDGTVIGIGGVTLSRENAGPYPAEFFNFRPDLTVMLHHIGLRTKQIQELQMP
jgi:hypothetical protein